MSGIESALPALLGSFLVRQRWFGGKAGTIAACRVADVADLRSTPETVAVIVSVSYAEGAPEHYAMLLTQAAEPCALPAVGRLDTAEDGWIVEAVSDPDTIRELLRGLTVGGDIATRQGGVLRYGDAGEAAVRTLGANELRITPLGAEQSNTSVRVGAGLVFKLFRRLQAGENPELEVGRFLTRRTQFRAMTALEGSVTYISRAGEAMTIGVLQTWIDNQGDGWSYVLAALREYLRTGTPPANLPGDMTRLGRITAEFHAALESDPSVEAFAPEPVQAGDLDTWSVQMLERASRALALIESRSRAWPEDARRLGQNVLSMASPEVMAALGKPRAGAFRKIRIHGDYHLGQTLKTSSGFAIIDFEGEPATPLSERRQKRAALKDVAGMLRSFDYAIDTVSERERDADRLRTSLHLREAFMEGYLETAATHGATSLPPGRQEIDAWLTFFELDKALYELEYEINNRPDWVHIPLRGIRRLLEKVQ